MTFFKLTATEEPGAGESFRQSPIRAGDRILTDRGCSTAVGIGHVAAAGGHVTVRANAGALPLQGGAARPFDLPAGVSALARAGTAGSWPARAVPRQKPPVPPRVRAVRKTDEAVRIALEAVRKGRQVQPGALQFARCVIVFTTFRAAEFPAAAVLIVDL